MGRELPYPEFELLENFGEGEVVGPSLPDPPSSQAVSLNKPNE